jgi:hypothetical protein
MLSILNYAYYSSIDLLRLPTVVVDMDAIAISAVPLSGGSGHPSGLRKGPQEFITSIIIMKMLSNMGLSRRVIS